jgi:type II secretory pathway pseudopilin PulG
MPDLSPRAHLVSTQPAARHGATLVEILIVISVVIVLLGLLLPALALVRTRVKKAEARQTIGILGAAFDLYRAEEPRRRYPPLRGDRGIHRDLLTVLDDRRLWSRGERLLNADGLLLDPWMQPYRYDLTRPAPTRGGVHLEVWNWNADAGREARWGDRRDPASGTTQAGPLPFPYLWSIGRRGTDDDASTWILWEDGT